MKANLKSANGFTKLLYVHGEKIGMAAIVACAGMLIWSALGVEQLKHKPEGLTTLTKKVSDTLVKTRWKDFPKEEVLDESLYQFQTLVAVQREHFPPPQYGLNRSVLAPAGKRTDPLLLPAEDLEVFSDAGLLATADPEEIHRRKLEAIRKSNQEEKEKKDRLEKSRLEGRRPGNRDRVDNADRGLFGQRDSRRKNKEGAIVVRPPSDVQLGGLEEIDATPWVVVLAKIPVELQHQHFEDALQGAPGYLKVRDTPTYFGYRVQRASVTPLGQQPWQTIMTVSRPTLRSRYAKYPFKPAEVVDKRYLHPLLTGRLLPLILYQWDQHVSHSSMPLPSEFNPYAPDESDSLESETQEGEDEFEDTILRRGPRNRQFGGRLEEEMRRRAEAGRSTRGPERNAGEFRGPSRGASLGRGSEVEIADFFWDGATPCVLLRYFDRDVQPGNKYRYRIKLILRDVNYCNPTNSMMIKERYLDKTVIDRKQGKEIKFRSTDWSEPSPIASVPMPGRVYLVSAEPAKESKFNDDPEAELLIKVLNSDYSAEIARSEKFARGSVINLQEKAEVVVASDFKPETEPEFDFYTGLTLIDFSGGEPLSRKNKQLTTPARAILMDPAGRLMLQTELEDYEPVAEFKKVIEGDNNNNNRRRREGRPSSDPHEEDRPQGY